MRPQLALVTATRPLTAAPAGLPPTGRCFRGPIRSAPARRDQKAFTLIELLLVLVILGILAAIVVPKFAGRTEQARQTAATSQIATFGTALDAFEVDNGYYPKGKNGLLDLVQQPRDAQNWKGPYMKGDIPNDPWGHPYLYECPGKHNPSSYDLMSSGPDGRVGGDDDVANWQQNKR
ncbi:MAG TPA: type II secretion system major pseudopilin GspG [Verrucomicrobiae bacterium]|jgi:general secretion pathway protein G|nr:type II secretion system major pseudopilin GspG [Verrucomicrobiae bacterium]